MKTIAVVAILLLGVVDAIAGTRLFGFYGAGGQWFSTGIDEIANQARNIPGVTHIAIYNYYETQRAATDINGVPSSDKVVIFGYSCGLNAATVVAAGVGRHVNTVVGIQQSLWCGGTDLNSNTNYGQSTYGNCIQTFGLGCKQLTGNTRILNIYRPDAHLEADNDPDAQADVLRAINLTAQGAPPHYHYGHGGKLVVHGAVKIKTGVAMVKKGVQTIERHHGQVP